MLLLGAILLALFVLPPTWGLLAVLGAALVEVGEVLLWIRLSRRARIRVGAEALIGATAEVVTACRPEGQVRVAGELWRAHCADGADKGERVLVTALNGLTLVVEPVQAQT